MEVAGGTRTGWRHWPGNWIKVVNIFTSRPRGNRGAAKKTAAPELARPLCDQVGGTQKGAAKCYSAAFGVSSAVLALPGCSILPPLLWRRSQRMPSFFIFSI